MGLDMEDEELLDEHEETICRREFDCEHTTRCQERNAWLTSFF